MNESWRTGYTLRFTDSVSQTASQDSLSFSAFIKIWILNWNVRNFLIEVIIKEYLSFSLKKTHLTVMHVKLWNLNAEIWRQIQLQFSRS